MSGGAELFRGQQNVGVMPADADKVNAHAYSGQIPVRVVKTGIFDALELRTLHEPQMSGEITVAHSLIVQANGIRITRPSRYVCHVIVSPGLRTRPAAGNQRSTE
jgi:hypothetical protein